MASDFCALAQADNAAAVKPVKSGVSRPAPLRVVVNAMGKPTDFVAKRKAPRMIQQLHGFRTAVSTKGGFCTQGFQRCQARFSCKQGIPDTASAFCKLL